MAPARPAQSPTPARSNVDSVKPLSPSAFGRLLAQYRVRAHLTQWQLQEKSAVAADTISALETGKRQRPHTSTVVQLIPALDLSPQEAALFREAARASRRSRRRASSAPTLRAVKAFTPHDSSTDAISERLPHSSEFGGVVVVGSVAPGVAASADDPGASQSGVAPLSVAAPAPPAPPALTRESVASRLSTSRRRIWASQVNMVATLAPVSLLMIALTIATMLFGQPQFASAARLPIGKAQVGGWLIYQQWATNTPSIMAVMDAATGQWRALWPDERFLSGGATSDAAQPFTSIRAPAYSSSRRRLAFISRNTDNTSSVWVASIGVGVDGWPVVTPPGPTELIANCDGCGSLTWSPDGAWLIYDTTAGLIARSPLTGEARRLTDGVGDDWPACSPDGQWLAFQRRRDANGGIVIAPAANCLPLAQATERHALYLNGFTPSWRPSWSPDSAMLAFVATTRHGRWAVWITRLRDLSPYPSYIEATNASQVSIPGCTDPTWATQRGSGRSVVIYSCDAPTSAQHHGSIVVTPGDMSAPTWQAALDTDIRAEQGGVWAPA